MNNSQNISLALVAVGVLLVVLRNVLDVDQTIGLVMSLGGSAIVIAGALLLWRAKRQA